MQESLTNKFLTELLIGEKRKIKIGKEVKEGVIYKSKDSRFPYQLLIEPKKGTIYSIPLENKLRINEGILESNYLYTSIYSNNLSRPWDKDNLEYFNRKQFFDEHNNSYKSLKKANSL